ncbi:MBL fold metallo-hydrolase [Vibrio ostreicida]|uniref:MBL fold metallo-hydrolase n=1 Tax=Vibrio ostreicida TaxID=526588 RepID=A0ABT8BSY1_9VIBR|nr:MBL fold metallo-hydrolase [Vibrio ostreicida]MDN3609882.1 MBL fold metallo-hydrolase [Vibrio ostreicida]NPD10002.1 MBL fold metallo-hydrolase [Vibrio ostreicida]
MKLHTIQGYIQTMYLAEYSDKLMLLDGASRADIPFLKHYITHTMGVPFTRLKMVVVTHMHPDHAGGAHKLRELTGCKIVSAEKEKQWYSGFVGIVMHLTDVALAGWVASRMKKPKRRLWYPRYLYPDLTLKDGQAIPGFEDWEVMETPGHTDRDLSLYHPQQRLLYVADLIVEVKKRLIAPFPIFHPNKYRQSLERVYQMSPKTLLLAHGGEVKLTPTSYQYLLDVAPITPTTHWRATKIKLKSLLGAVWLFGVSDK